jgi:DNA-binding MarR family transcriptional regulator
MKELLVKKEDFQESFLRMITRGYMSNLEYSVLAECCKAKEVTTEVRKDIRKVLKISQYNLNNVISKLVKGGIFLHKEDDGSLKVPSKFIVNDLGVVTIKLKENG